MTRKELANAIRALSMDAVQKANSGHPGAPMGGLLSSAVGFAVGCNKQVHGNSGRG